MKPYIVVVELPAPMPGNDQPFVEQFEDVSIAHDWAIGLTRSGARCYIAAVLIAPEPLAELAKFGRIDFRIKCSRFVGIPGDHPGLDHARRCKDCGRTETDHEVSS